MYSFVNSQLNQSFEKSEPKSEIHFIDGGRDKAWCISIGWSDNLNIMYDLIVDFEVKNEISLKNFKHIVIFYLNF